MNRFLIFQTNKSKFWKNCCQSDRCRDSQRWSKWSERFVWQNQFRFIANDCRRNYGIFYCKRFVAPSNPYGLYMILTIDIGSNPFTGLARREFDRNSVKMHMTLINTKYSNKNESNDDDIASKHRQQKVKAYFDARTIIETYANYEFGTQSINEIHLCLIHSVACDGFYQTTTSIKFW